VPAAAAVALIIIVVGRGVANCACARKFAPAPVLFVLEFLLADFVAAAIENHKGIIIIAGAFLPSPSANNGVVRKLHSSTWCIVIVVTTVVVS
jgi:hypothetical protein